MSDTSFIDLTVPLRRDFSQYYLKRNPFPSIGVPEETPLITVDRERVIRLFRENVSRVVDSEQSILTVVVGEYGSGKSHLFKIFKENINRQLYSREDGMLAVYVKSPGDDFLDLLLGYIDDIGRPFLEKLASEVILEYLSNLQRAKILEYLPYPDLVDKIQNNKIHIADITSRIRTVGLLRDIFNSRMSNITNRDIAYAILYLTYNSKSTAAWKWLSGGNLSSSERDSINVNSNIGSSNAYEIFLNINAFFNSVGIRNIAIFLDELEKILSLRSNVRAEYQDDIRQMIDDLPNHALLYLAIAPAQWEEITKETSAFVRRLEGNWILLDEFRENDVEELIERYLYTVRIDNFQSVLKNIQTNGEKQSLYPFTRNSLIEIQELTEGVVSRVLILCRKSLDYLHDHQDIYDVISPETVKEALAERG